MYCIYKVENLVNGRCYIGSCLISSMASNKYRHLSGRGNQQIADDLRSYSRSDFWFAVLNEGFETKEEANKFEQMYIQVFNAYYGGYNATVHGR